MDANKRLKPFMTDLAFMGSLAKFQMTRMDQINVLE